MSSAPHEAGAAPSALGLVREAAALGVAAARHAWRARVAIELTEARERAARWLVLALVAGVLLLAALLVGSLWVVSIFWDSHRSEAIAVVAAVYALAGGGMMWWLVARLRAAPPLLQATLSELKQDCDALRGASRNVAMTRRSRDELALRREALATRAALQRIELAAALDQAREVSLARKGIGVIALQLARSFVASRSGPTVRLPRAALDAFRGLGARARACALRRPRAG